MKRFQISLIRVLFIGLASMPLMTLQTQAQTSKYGVVDMQRIILTVEEGKKARETLQKEIKEKENELLKQKAELDKMNQDWKSQAPLLSEEARMNKQKEFQEKFISLRNAEMEFQAEIKRKEQKATQQIAVKVASLVENIADTKALDAVFEANSSGLIYLRSPVDLTDEIIKNYDQEAKKKRISQAPQKSDKKTQ